MRINRFANTELLFGGKARVRVWLTLEPDLQYIAKPSGLERDALCVGFVFEATL
jgi:carbohydrate-selective porin OprB